MPIALPLSFGGKTLMATGMFVAKIIAEPKAWKILARRITTVFGENIAKIEASPNVTIPARRTLRLLVVSAIFPKGTENAAIIREYAVTSQPTDAAPILKCAPISGIAKFRALPANAVMNDVLMPTMTADRF
jgi:hypothetical protein